MDNFFLIVIISSAIIICLLMVNCINNEKEKFLNHGAYLIKDKKYKDKLENEKKGINYYKDIDAKIKQGEKISFSKKENLMLIDISKKAISKINNDFKIKF